MEEQVMHGIKETGFTDDKYHMEKEFKLFWMIPSNW